MSVSCIDLHKTLPCLRDLDRQQYAAARRTRARIPRQARQVQAQRSSKKEDHWGNGLDQKRRRDKKGVVLVSLFTRRKPTRSYRVRAPDVKRSRKNYAHAVAASPLLVGRRPTLVSDRTMIPGRRRKRKGCTRRGRAKPVRARKESTSYPIDDQRTPQPTLHYSQAHPA